MPDVTPNASDRLVIESIDESTLRLTGEIDPLTAPALDAEVRRVISQSASDVVIDMVGIDFVDSSGLRVFADAQRALEPGGRALVLRHPTAALQTLLDVTGLAPHIRTE